MSVYRVNGMSSCFDELTDLMEYIMQQGNGYMASLNHQLVVKEQDGIIIVLYHIEVNVDNRVLRFVRPRRG